MSDKNTISGKHTLVEEGTELKGTVTSNCPIVVMGKVEGEVTGPIIHVTASGVVAGKVKVSELRSDGEIAGEFEAETVKIAGRVRDKTVIRARTLEVALSREAGTEVTFGDCELAIGDEPNKQAAIDATLATAAPVVEAEKPAPAGKASRRKAAAEASWDETAAAPTSAPIETEEDGTPKRRKTIPPPMS